MSSTWRIKGEAEVKEIKEAKAITKITNKQLKTDMRVIKEDIRFLQSKYKLLLEERTLRELKSMCKKVRKLHSGIKNNNEKDLSTDGQEPK